MEITLEAGAEPVPGYRLVGRLGRGGCGEVWKATGPGGFELALKFVCLAEPVGQPELRAIQIIKDVRHPHLLATFGAWQVGRYLIIAMELAERTLLDRFREAAGQGFPGIPAPEIHEHFLDAARGLDYLNEPRHPSGGTEPVGIQHRDVKPQNLLLVGGSVKVADFGLARILEHTQTSHTGSMTPAYAAPEFFKKQTSSQSDQYSLAVTYCHLRGGRLPFTGGMAEIMAGHLLEPPDLTMLPEGEREAAARALAKEPRDRWGSCRAFVEALRSEVPARDRVAPRTGPVETSARGTFRPGEAGEASSSAEGPGGSVSPGRPARVSPPAHWGARPEVPAGRRGRKVLALSLSLTALSVIVVLGLWALGLVPSPALRSRVRNNKPGELTTRPPAGSPVAAKTPPQPVPPKSGDESAYQKQRGQVEGVKRQAEAVGGQIEDEAKKSPGGVADRIARLRRRHPNLQAWLNKAEEASQRARGLGANKSYTEAASALNSAESEYGKLLKWWERAQQALSTTDRTRSALEQQLAGVPPDTAQVLTNWPAALTKAVEEKLLEGEGEEGLAEARRMAERLPQIEKLLGQRRGVVDAAQKAKESAGVESLRPRYVAATAKLREADDALVKGQLEDGPQLYLDAGQGFRDLVAGLNEHIAGLLAAGKRELEAGRPEGALEKAQQVLALRPEDEGAQELKKRAETTFDPRRAIGNSLDMKLMLIPAGEFLMGSPDTDKDAFDNEKPQHRVRITRPFYLGVHEVTRGQFRRFVDDSGYQTEAEKDGKGGWGWNGDAKKFEQNPKYTWLNPGFDQTDEHPVVNVSWNDAVAFAEWLSRKEGVTYRLPTEAEWEYACRAGTTTKYCNGNDPEGLAAVANIADGTLKTKYPNWSSSIAAQDGFIYTAPVGRYNPNAWGLFDMQGNVWEWCSDGYAADYYKRSPVDDPQGPDGASIRVHRGGGWSDGPRLARSASRIRFVPEDRNFGLGFRLARVQSVR